MEKVIIKFEADAKDLQNMKKELQETGKVSEQTVQKFIEIQKVTTKADEGFKSLKQQIRETKEEAQKMAQQFGENSKQATAAAQKVANLTEDLDDFNKRVAALNPEAKFNALQGALQGAFGAFQGLTGAVQLFGGESKKAEEIARKFQGAINMAQGLNSLLGLKDAFSNLRLVLTASTAATEVQAVAMGELAVAEEGATVAAVELNTAMSMAGIGAAVAVVGALVLAIVALEDSLDESAKKTEALKLKWRDLDAARGTYDARFLEAQKEQLDNFDFEIKKAEALQKTEGEILKLKIAKVRYEQESNNRTIAGGNATDELTKKLVARQKELRQELELLNIQFDRLAKPREIPPIKMMVKGIDVEQAKKAIEEVNQGLRDDGLDGVMVEVPYKAIPLNNDIIKRDLFDLFVQDINTVLPLYQNFSSSIMEINRNQTDARLMELEEQKNAGILSETQYQQRVRELKRKAAKEDKEMAVFQASIGIASAIINALNTRPASAVPFAVASASAIGAFQLAAILSRPLPKFNQGKLPQFAGTYTGSDNQLAWVASEEAIIPALKTRAYYPTLEAVYKGTISPKDFNDFVKGKTKGNKTDLKATINPYDLSRAMNNRKVKIANSSELARSIASELTGQYSARRL